MTTKTCTKCKEEKDISEFNKRNSKQGGYNTQCKTCINLYRNEWRAKNRAAGKPSTEKIWQQANRDHLNKQRATKRREIRDYLRSLKLNQPCTDCGGIFPPTCMDWDHLDPANKEFDICQDSTRELYSKEKIHAEIAKCEIVCANCHRIRSAIQRGDDPWALY
jgi:hypothetical protein